MLIKKRLKLAVHSWKKDLFNNRYKVYAALLLLLIASSLNSLAGNYTSEIQGYYTADIILDHFKPIDLGILFVWGYLSIVLIFFVYPLLFKPDKLHIAIIMFSVLVFIRAVFICLTHLVTPPTAIEVHFPWILGYFRYQNDMFFSGHTSIPFLGFLIFRNKAMKRFMLISSITMAITVLLMHQHYSIDVFAAFFITYGIYKIGERVFNEKLPA